MQILNLKKYIKIDSAVAEAKNLVDRLDPDDATAIGELVWDGYTRDKNSRAKWERRNQAGMDLALQIQKDKNFPWQGCSNVVFPLVTIAALQFSARSYSNIIQGTDVVRYRTVGIITPETKAQSDRISDHMSWQVLEEDTAWEEQHDRLLINLAIVGCAFIKSYFSPSEGHNVSELVMARDLVLDYYAKSVDAAASKTHIVPLYRNEIYERCIRGIFVDVREENWFEGPAAQINDTNTEKHDNRQGIEPPPSDEDTPYTTLEQHRNLDLDGDGYAEPYIATIEADSHKLLRLVARWESEKDVERTASGEIIKIKATEYFTKYSFIPAPDGGIYDSGFGILIGPLNESVNTGINQLLDAGTMQNSSGGFLGRGAKIRGGVYTMAPWEWKRVDSTGDDLRKSMVPFPERQPSMVMFQLLELLIQYTDRIAGTVEQQVGENPGQNTPAETSRNTLEQGMQVYAVIFKRVWRAMKEEFKKLHQLNGRYLPLVTNFGSKGSSIKREDYLTNPDQVIPVADPNIVSKATRIAMAGAVRAAAYQAQGYNLEEVERDFLKALGVQEVDRIYPGPEKVPPLPNPKMQIENTKLQVKTMELKQEKELFLVELQMGQRKTLAEIRKLEAEVIKLLAGVQSEHAALQLKGYEVAIDALQEHNKMMNERIKALGESDGESGDNQGSAGRMEGSSPNAGLLPAPSGVAAGGNGAMGGGGLQ